MKIPVVYKSGQEDQVEPKFLDILLHLGEVQEFRRKDHWVNVMEDPIRTPRQQHDSFQGIDRRRHPDTRFDFPS